MKETRPAAAVEVEKERANARSESLWYKDAIIYQVHVRAFADSKGDGMGDFRGLASRLDYLRDLGVTAIWLLPFYPSPLRDDGYDIADYTGVHPDYGTVADFRLFLREAHRRGIRVITELVLNHTSDQHPWFQRARRAQPCSPERDFYVWSDTPDRYREARIIFKDFEDSNWSWDPVARAYYWHRFYHHQPDLNYGNPEVRKTMLQTLDFWLGMGVDGLRLDAVPYLCEREGTNCENLPESHDALRELRRHVDAGYGDRMLLAEANQWPEDAAAYFGTGDECHMAFHFPVMPRLFMAVRMEARYPVIDILTQTPPIPETCQWAVFLRNHDELTLETVTDEERDYMYRVYAHDPRARVHLGIRRRLAPLMGNDRRRIELMNGLLFSLPGTPVIYYGDEIGMGDNIYLGDRNAVRTPMQWSADRNAGFSRANSQRLYLPVVIDPDFHYETVNVEVQQNNPTSLLWWMRRLIAVRKRFKAFGRGSLEFLQPDNSKVLAFVRRFGDERILVVANLSRHAQYVELDLAAHRGMVPVELSGQTRFPSIGELPYLLTLGAHAFYWFALEPERAEAGDAGRGAEGTPPPFVRVSGRWDEVFRKEGREALESALPAHLATRRWFAGKARRLESVEVIDAVPAGNAAEAVLALLRVAYTEGDPEIYLLPLGFATGARAREIEASAPREVIARLAAQEGEGILHDALLDGEFCEALVDAIGRRRHLKGIVGEISATPARAFREARGSTAERLAPYLIREEQSNSSVLCGDRLILKLFRRVDEGTNPDLEIGRFLTERASFPHAPALAGALEYRSRRNEPLTLAVLYRFVPNEGNAWSYTQDILGRYFERVASRAGERGGAEVPGRSLLELAGEEIPLQVREVIGLYLESAALLGQRTADLHRALASDLSDPDFAPEPFSPHYQRALYQSMRNLTDQAFDRLRKSLRGLSEGAQGVAREVLARKDEVLARFLALRERRITALRTRIHGDYHLGQVLWTGKDFVIIDFEGEAARPLNARRIKRSPLRDVTGMLRSFRHAARMALEGQTAAGVIRREELVIMEPWAELWVSWVSAAFLRAYLEGTAGSQFVPAAREEQRILLDSYLLEKAVDELAHELENRPDRVPLALRGILHLLRSPA